MKKTRAWLQKVRISYDKTQQQVANEAGIKRAYYTMIENGTRTPSPAVAKRIAGVLNFDWTIFFKDICSETKHCSNHNSDDEQAASREATGTDG